MCMVIIMIAIVFRHDTIFSAARSMSDICLLLISIFQSISCRNIMLSSCSPAQIYTLLLSRKISSLQNRSLIYSAVVLMDTIEFMYDSYNFLNNWSTLHYIPIFNISLSGFIIFTVYLSHLKYIFFIWCVTACPMFESFAQLNSSMWFCTSTMTYYVCHLHVLYIWDIYLSIYCYWLIPCTTCYCCHFQNMTTVYNWYVFSHELM